MSETTAMDMCPTCYGTGIVGRGDTGLWMDLRCPACDGEGLIVERAFAMAAELRGVTVDELRAQVDAYWVDEMPEHVTFPYLSEEQARAIGPETLAALGEAVKRALAEQPPAPTAGATGEEQA